MDETNSEAISMQEVIDSLAPQEQAGDADAPQFTAGEHGDNPGPDEPGADGLEGEAGQKEALQGAREDEKDAPEAQKGSGVSDEQVDAVRTLLADGWTRDELLAFSRDETAQKDMAGGKSMRQAALAYMRRQSAPAHAQDSRKRGAPIARNTSSGGNSEVDVIRNMSDAQYDRFMADMRRRAMRGEKIRI